jgi:hypothetical protein
MYYDGISFLGISLDFHEIINAFSFFSNQKVSASPAHLQILFKTIFYVVEASPSPFLILWTL